MGVEVPRDSKSTLSTEIKVKNEVLDREEHRKSQICIFRLRFGSLLQDTKDLRKRLKSYTESLWGRTESRKKCEGLGLVPEEGRSKVMTFYKWNGISRMNL